MCLICVFNKKFKIFYCIMPWTLKNNFFFCKIFWLHCKNFRLQTNTRISIFWIFGIFKALFALSFGLIQYMLPKWTFCQQLLRIPSKIFFGNLIYLMSPKTFISNIMASQNFFRVLKTEQKVKKWKDFVCSIHFWNL